MFVSDIIFYYIYRHICIVSKFIIVYMKTSLYQWKSKSSLFIDCHRVSEIGKDGNVTIKSAGISKLLGEIDAKVNKS